MVSSGNGDGSPENGPPDGLPGLPADWGTIVVPDDAAELAHEAALIRLELSQRNRRDRWRRRLGLHQPGGSSSPLRVSILILTITIIATLASFLAAVWPGQARQSPPRATPTGAPSRPLPSLDLVGEGGETVPLRGLLPAMILFVDGCDCADEVDAAARAAPPGVTVVALISGTPEPTPIPRQPAIVAAPVRSLADPTAELRDFLRLPHRPGVASAVLATRTGQVIRTLPTVTSTTDYQSDLASLANY